MSARWIIHEPLTLEVQQQFPEQDRVILQLLWNRGLCTQEDMDRFLGPDWSRDTYPPSLFLNMARAVDRIFHALLAGESITIHGDYDADGTCGTAVLITTLREICRALSFDEKKIMSYIPHREKEGYGLSVSTIEHLAQHEKTKLVITVDCGISNKSAIDRGRELGIDTIVCDHHTLPVELPTSAILIHPLVPGETFPNKRLCGTGVTFKLASALIAEARRRGAAFPEGHEKWLLDLVAIATITDVMPLCGENRVLEKYGLLVLNKARRPGIRKLLEVAGSTIGSLDTVSIGFHIGPRLNAAGRMTHANEALELLIQEDSLRATVLAMRLHELNIERQKASQALYEQAKQQLEAQEHGALIVVWQEGWSAGLVGLVAGKLVQEYHRPVFVVSQNGERFIGSGRGIEGFDMTSVLEHVKEHLDAFGGHPQACGFSVTGSERFHRVVAAMRAFVAQQVTPDDLEPCLYVDMEIALHEVTWKLFEGIELFEPFGAGNPVPLFLSRGVRVVSCSRVGRDGGHLKLRVQSETGTMIEAIAFGFGTWTQTLSIGSRVDVVYEIEVNEWNGNRQLQIRIVDLSKVS